MPRKPGEKPPEDRKKNKRCTPFNAAVSESIVRFQAEFMSTAEAAAELGLAENTMRKYCQDGCFTNAKAFGHEWVVSRYDITWWKVNRRGRIGRPEKRPGDTNWN